MTREEIITALLCCVSYDDNDCKICPLLTNTECLIALKTAVVDLIENQQRHIEALMKANDSLKDAIARRDKQIEDMNQGMAQLTKAVAVKEEQSELHAMKNELCQYCGKYKQAHEGACDGCRWREK